MQCTNKMEELLPLSQTRASMEVTAVLAAAVHTSVPYVEDMMLIRLFIILGAPRTPIFTEIGPSQFIIAKLFHRRNLCLYGRTVLVIFFCRKHWAKIVE